MSSSHDQHDTEFQLLLAENERLKDSLMKILNLVNQQAEDEGLWSLPLCECGQLDCPQTPKQRIAEAYLQQELRKLHALIENETESLVKEKM